MGSRWRQENYFRYARMHFNLDSHDAYATTGDDPDRLVPNPAKKKAHRQVLAARGAYERALARTDAALLDAKSPAPGKPVLITNQAHDAITADLRQAEADLDGAQAAHRGVPTRLPLAQVNPGQQVLNIQTKLLTHAIRMSAFNTITALARAVRVYTGYARADDEAHSLVRQALTGSGDIDPGDGVLTVRLDPLPTQRATTAIAELCEHLTATETCYPGTDLVLSLRSQNPPLTAQEISLHVGSPDLKAGLGIAAMSAARTNGTYLQSRYKRLAARRGAMRALVATEHSMIVSIWNMLSTGEIYNELGADYYGRNNPSRARRRAVAQLTQLELLSRPVDEKV